MVAVKQANVVENYSEADIVILSREEYEELQKAKRNAEYIAKLKESIKQVEEGKVFYHDIIEDDD